MKVSLDSNVLVYAVDLADLAKQKLAIDFINRAAQAGGTLTEQALFEFLHVVVRKFGFPRDRAFEMVRRWCGLFDLVATSDTLIDDTEALMQKHNLGVWDSRLVALCDAADVSLLLSEDLHDGGRYGRVLVVNPFLAANTQILDTVLPP